MIYAAAHNDPPAHLMPERRHAERFAAGVLGERRIVARLEMAPWLVCVRDISANGISFVVASRVVPGEMIALRLFNTDRRFECALWARVAHVQPRGDGDFTIGAQFTDPLTAEELTGLGLA